jgi:hypothetical protein
MIQRLSRLFRLEAIKKATSAMNAAKIMTNVTIVHQRSDFFQAQRFIADHPDIVLQNRMEDKGHILYRNRTAPVSQTGQPLFLPFTKCLQVNLIYFGPKIDPI